MRNLYLKSRGRNVISIALALFCTLSVTGQTFNSVELTTGLNADVIANGVGAPSTTTSEALEGGYVFFSEDYQLEEGDPLQGIGLPTDGIIDSPTSDATFMMAPFATPYEGNNSMKIATTGNSGTFTFDVLNPAEDLYFLLTSGGGTSNLTASVSFTDGTTQELGNTFVPDWYNSSALPVAISGIGRVNLESEDVDSPFNNPRIYQLTIDIDLDNQTKTIDEVTFTKASGGGVINIFAMSYKEAASCIAPVDIEATDITALTAEISWTATSAQTAWQIVVQAAGTGVPTTDGEAVTETSYSAADLTPDMAYEVYVRSNCDPEFSDWSGPLNFTTAVGCDVPTDVMVSNVTSTSADFTWTAAAGQIDWEVALVPIGEDAPESGVMVDSEMYEATDLEIGTTYDFYVRGNCGETLGYSQWAGPVTFGGYTSMEIVSGFNADVIANGVGSAAETTTNDLDGVNYVYMAEDWQLNEGDDLLGFGLPADGLINSNAVAGLFFNMAPFGDPYEGNNSLRIEEIGAGDTLTFANSEPAQELYLAGVSGSGSANFTGEIFFSDGTTQDIASTLVPDWFFSTAQPVIISGIGRLNLTNNNYENPFNNPRVYQMEVAISAQNQAKTIDSLSVIKSSGSGVLNIFAVSMQYAPACISPENLAISNIAPTSATATWTFPEGQTDWEVAYVDAGADAPEVGTAVEEATYDFTDLTEGMSYDVYVRSNCGNSFSDWVGPVTFTTPTNITCDGLNNFVVCYENDQNLSWFYSSSDGSPLSIAFNAGSLEANNFGGTTYDDLIIYDGSSADGAVLFNSDDDGNALTGLSFEAASGYLYITLTSDVSNSCQSSEDIEAIDFDVYCSSFVPCEVPTDLAFADITENSANLSWTAPEGQTNWEVVIQLNGTGEPTEAGDATTDNPYAANDLVAGATYEFYVRADCGDGAFSEWAGPVIFTALESTECGTPAMPSISSVTETTAELSWLPGPDQTLWEVSVQTPGSGVPTEAGTEVTENPYTIEDLDPSTAYEVYVRAICGEDASDWAGPVNFTTQEEAVCPVPTDLVASDITATTAVLAWTAEEGQNEWEVVVQLADSGEPTAAGDIVSEPIFNAEILLPQTAYEFYVRAICGAELASDFAGPEAFSTISTDINDVTFNGFTYFPNPFTDKLTLNSDGTIETVRVFNIVGEQILSVTAFNTTSVVDLSTVGSGIYLMEVTIDGQSKTFRVVKQ